ncbi:hypothetical protein FF011L_23400 [Roseimaritima multifibrata]|uniref:Uncharacterized protein n=1 Tax=Roseimaritima multifibrata TaxID=1930274 RepID=A0A517MFA4_9BACT|nr:hypothetical protein FF011L_23400 [Roseimaritima multifibrata]
MSTVHPSIQSAKPPITGLGFRNLIACVCVTGAYTFAVLSGTLFLLPSVYVVLALLAVAAVVAASVANGPLLQVCRRESRKLLPVIVVVVSACISIASSVCVGAVSYNFVH